MIGKIQDKAYRQLVNDYSARCQGRIGVEIVHCKTPQEVEKRLSDREYIVALDENGKEFDSMSFSRWLSDKIKSGLSRLTVCLGGAAGHSPAVRNKARESIALSRLTLNHQMALAVFAEQTYRALSILFGEPYHKP